MGRPSKNAVGNFRSRRQVERILSKARLSAIDLKEIVDKYMGDSPVPPRWTPASVKGVFGVRIYRLWSRKIKNRRHVSYRSKDTGRWLTPVVQTWHDVGADTIALMNRMYEKNGAEISAAI